MSENKIGNDNKDGNSVIAALQTHEQNGKEIIEDKVYEEFLSKSSPTDGDNNLSET